MLMWLRQTWAKLIWLPMDYLREDHSEVTQRAIVTVASVWHRIWIDGPFLVLIVLLVLKADSMMEEDDGED